MRVMNLKQRLSWGGELEKPSLSESECELSSVYWALDVSRSSSKARTRPNVKTFKGVWINIDITKDKFLFLSFFPKILNEPEADKGDPRISDQSSILLSRQNQK